MFIENVVCTLLSPVNQRQMRSWHLAGAVCYRIGLSIKICRSYGAQELGRYGVL